MSLHKTPVPPYEKVKWYLVRAGPLDGFSAMSSSKECNLPEAEIVISVLPK